MEMKAAETAHGLQSTPLRIGISASALFDIGDEFTPIPLPSDASVSAGTKLAPGTAFEIVQRLLDLNPKDEKPLVEVVFISREAPDYSLSAFSAAAAYGLNIREGSFSGGARVAPFVVAWNVDLFLSTDEADVREAIANGTAAAKLSRPPPSSTPSQNGEVRIAFDGDSVIFNSEADIICRRDGRAAFFDHERHNATNPIALGPFGKFFQKLAFLRAICEEEGGRHKVIIAIVTARNAPAHERMINTLRAWGTPADEAHFVGAKGKAPFVKAFGAHIYFDDHETHIAAASSFVPTGHVIVS